ncbi:MAG: protein kinase [Candidatus Eisenbacteria bacterium]
MSSGTSRAGTSDQSALSTERDLLDATKWLASAKTHLNAEAQRLARVKSPNVAAIVDFDYHEGVPFLVMDLVEGLTLRDYVNTNALSGRARLALARGIANGLADIHAQGIIHRDLIPANVMVERGGVPRILDFGIAALVEASEASDAEAARAAAHPGSNSESDGFVCSPDPTSSAAEGSDARHAPRHSRRIGTPGYIAPEGNGTQLSDIWTFGRLLEDLFPPQNGSRGSRERTQDS